VENLPVAYISHQSQGRVRFRIDSQRGKVEYFTELETAFEKEFPLYSISTTLLTGSLLITGDGVNAEAVIRWGTDQLLFTMKRSNSNRKPISLSIGNPIVSAKKKIRQFSGGAIDVPGVIFISALMFGVYELIIGNFRRPPWYTAFWYAFGMYSKSYFDYKSENTGKPELLSD